MERELGPGFGRPLHDDGCPVLRRRKIECYSRRQDEGGTEHQTQADLAVAVVRRLGGPVIGQCRKGLLAGECLERAKMGMVMRRREGELQQNAEHRRECGVSAKVHNETVESHAAKVV